MKFLTKTSIKYVTAFAMSLLPLIAVQAQESKIGFVNHDRIFREAAIAKAADARIEQEFSKRAKEMQELDARVKATASKLDKEAALLSEPDRTKRQRELIDMDKDLQRKQREFREDLNQRKNEELAVIVDRTNKVIKQIAETEKYDLVFQEAVYVNPRIDITDKVLKALNSK